MDRRYLAALAVLVAVNVVLVGLLYSRLTAPVQDPLAPKGGFVLSDMHYPAIPSYDPHDWDAAPAEHGSGGAAYSFASRYNLGTAYAIWGGELRCWVCNTGQKDIFLYGVRIDGDWGAVANVSLGLLIQPNEERYVGMLHITGPPIEGTRNFTVVTALMTKPWGLGHPPMPEWTDLGWVAGEPKTVNFLPVGNATRYSCISNPSFYFDKVNKIVSSADPAVAAVAAGIAADYPSSFNIYHAAAAFDYVYNNITYVNDPAGRDYWAPPAETLSKRGGDCEDHALLFSALVTALNGTTRFHMEKDHAFSSVFVGTGITAAQQSLEKYYNTGLQVTSYQDKFGYWVVADSTAAFYLGGLPLGGQPLAAGWDLTNTTFHYTVDIMRD